MHRIRVYTRTNCGWCDAVKRLLSKHSHAFQEVRVDEDDDAMRFLAQQLAFTVPQVFVGSRRIGGYEATVESLISGELDRLLEQQHTGARSAEHAR